MTLLEILGGMLAIGVMIALSFGAYIFWFWATGQEIRSLEERAWETEQVNSVERTPDHSRLTLTKI